MINRRLDPKPCAARLSGPPATPGYDAPRARVLDRPGPRRPGPSLRAGYGTGPRSADPRGRAARDRARIARDVLGGRDDRDADRGIRAPGRPPPVVDPLPD